LTPLLFIASFCIVARVLAMMTQSFHADTAPKDTVTVLPPSRDAQRHAAASSNLPNA